MANRAVATLTHDFQLPIPEAVRDQYDLKAGQEFVFVPTDEGLLLVRVPTVEEMSGMFRGADTSDVRDHADRY